MNFSVHTLSFKFDSDQLKFNTQYSKFEFEELHASILVSDFLFLMQKS